MAVLHGRGWQVESQSSDERQLKARVAALERRVLELETLCVEVYVAGIELGLPEALITRLWTIAAQGNRPEAFRLEGPPPPARIAATRPPETAAMPIPDMTRVDRALRESGARRPSRRGLERFKLLPRRLALIVDDDPLMLEVLVRILRHENFELLTAPSGPAALAAAEGRAVDLLVTDYHMPEMKGPELADRLRRRLPGLRVLYQTGFSDQLFEDRVELAEGEAFLEKPFTHSGLREAVRLVLYGYINP